ncbi:hypothetical protein P3T23_002947 [Paraburkholderia sp. GAS448]
MPTLSSLVVTRLMSGFEDFLHFHAESLAADETELLTSMIALADDSGGDLSPTQSIIPHSYLTREVKYRGRRVPEICACRTTRERAKVGEAPKEGRVCFRQRFRVE